MIITKPPVEMAKKKRAENSFFPNIEPHLFSQVVNKMRLFFLEKGYQEVHTQNRLSIMAACEDPNTIATYNYNNEIWPLPQTGQMWLEYELLTKPEVPGYFCLSTSYRNEPNPIEGRHCLIFPMFEFELHGGIDELIKVEMELLEYLGFGSESDFLQGKYLDVAKTLNVTEIDREEEETINLQTSPRSPRDNRIKPAIRGHSESVQATPAIIQNTRRIPNGCVVLGVHPGSKATR